MKYKDITLTMIVVCLIALIIAIYIKPTPNRYRFVPDVSNVAEGFTTSIYRIQDTATGKAYEWLSVISLPSNNETTRLETVTMRDPVHNKTYFKHL